MNRFASSPCQKSGNAAFAGESACATSMDQQFATQSGAGFSLPGLLTRAARAGCMVAIAASALLASDGVMVSVRAAEDVALDTYPDSALWRDAQPVLAELDNHGKRVPGYGTEVRSRWTSKNIYFLFQCPYQELYLKPHPTTTAETNELWKWDVAEVFIGSDFENIRHYREFEVSPQGEWIDLDIDLSKPHHENGRTWNSGFQAAARIDASGIWYAALRIPLSAIDSRPPKEGTEFRINLYRSQGPPSNHVAIAWQPTLSDTFHVPDRFGVLKLAGEPAHSAVLQVSERNRSSQRTRPSSETQAATSTVR